LWALQLKILRSLFCEGCVQAAGRVAVSSTTTIDCEQSFSSSLQAVVMHFPCNSSHVLTMSSLQQHQQPYDNYIVLHLLLQCIECTPNPQVNVNVGQMQTTILVSVRQSVDASDWCFSK
jgi:hypothetical protein